MLIQFDETFELPLERVFPYFQDPVSWVKLYGEAAPVYIDSQGWTRIPLKRFPLPLKAKLVHFEHGKKVMWMFGGFWRGIAQIEFCSIETLADQYQTRIFGFEYIVPHGFWFAEGWVSQTFMQKEFERIWALGWKRLRKSCVVR